MKPEENKEVSPAVITMTNSATGEFKMTYLGGLMLTGNTSTGILVSNPGPGDSTIRCTGQFNTAAHTYVGDCLPIDADVLAEYKRVNARLTVRMTKL